MNQLHGTQSFLEKLPVAQPLKNFPTYYGPCVHMSVPLDQINPIHTNTKLRGLSP
jgi:hypothetical protein